MAHSTRASSISHPLWEQQVELEESMAARGAELFKQQVGRASDGGRLTTVGPVRDLLDDWLNTVADAVRQQARQDETLRAITRAVEARSLAFLGLRVALNGFGRNRLDVRKLAPELGRTVEDELRVRLLTRGTPEQKAAWKHLQRELKRKRASTKGRLQESRELTNDILEDSYPRWSKETAFRVGADALNAVIMATGLFELAQGAKAAKRGWKPPLLLATKADAAQRLEELIDRMALFQTEYWPTIIPPRPWVTPRVGAYWTETRRQPRLVRADATDGDIHLGADAMPKVYRAVNALQGTAYRVNTRVLYVLSKTWTELGWHGDRACLPAPEDREVPPPTERMKAHERVNKVRKPNSRTEPNAKTKKDIAEWKRLAAQVLSFNRQRQSRYASANATFQLAQKFAGYDAIYFPHNMDFRGRMYPIPAYLQPQGDDLARGLLTYADGMPITEQNGGVRWLAIQVASVWGLDKASYEERVAWTMENEAFMRDIVADPYANDQWFHKADKPWEFLAACYEWVDYLDAKAAGKEFYSSLPIMVDGTCNGIQHLSALVRDEVGGKLVNLIPGDRPRDIYKVVAEDLQDVLEGIVKGKRKGVAEARWWLSLCGGTLPRSLTKRQVMVLPYGGTREAFLKYTQEWLDEHHPVQEGATKGVTQQRFKAALFLAGHMWQSVKRNVRSAERVMEWLKECVEATNALDLPLEWVAPSGFRVRQFERQMSGTQIDIKIMGERYQPQIGELTDRLDKVSQTAGVAPNFIHSLDAAALVETINLCSAVGISSFTAIHDAYGTHAANMDVLSTLLREGFINTHVAAPLEAFRAAIEGDLRAALSSAGESASATLPEALSTGALSLDLVANSEYFFS